MRLSGFIRANIVPIAEEWERFARDTLPFGPDMGGPALRSHMVLILDFVIANLTSAQSAAGTNETSCDTGAVTSLIPAAEAHASLRYESGFNIDQIVSEYSALRAGIVGVWKASRTTLTMEDVDDLLCFNKAVDHALKDAITGYSRKVESSQTLFLGILGHDLRNPLGAISMSAEMMTRFGGLSTRQTLLSTQILESAGRAQELIENMLDATRARLGSGLPIARQPMDMGLLARQLVDEMRAMHPSRKFEIEVSGDVTGLWDKARIGQALSNLIGNAIQYSFQSSPIKIDVAGTAPEVALSVHNYGVPISVNSLGYIFSALTSGQQPNAGQDRPNSANLGLGLFISKEIVAAHDGEIQVSSSEKDGTVFRMSFPRRRDGVAPKSFIPANTVATASAGATA